MGIFLVIRYSTIRCPRVPSGQSTGPANKRNQAATQAERKPTGLLLSLCVFLSYTLTVESDDDFLNDDNN